MEVIVAGGAAAAGFGLAVVLAKAALSALLLWTYSRTGSANSLPVGARSRTPTFSSAESSM